MRILTPSWASVTRWFVLVLFAANFIWAANYLLIQYNPLFFDHGGHLAAGIQLFRNGFHGFNDQLFLGNTQNLFYPPLEDFILGLFSKVSGYSTESIFPKYLVVLIFAFLASIFNVVRGLRSVLGILFFGATSLLLFNLNKLSDMKYQGWSFFDLQVIGLSSQFLAGIGFFAICRMWVNQKHYRRNRAVFWTAFALLSHIVVGLIVVAMLGMLSLRQNKFKKACSDVIIAIGLTAFYLVPFFWYGKYLSACSIYFSHTWYLLAIMVLSVLVVRKRFRTTGGFYWIAIGLYCCLTFLAKWDASYNVNIPFHFYRLAIISFFLFAVALTTDLDDLDFGDLRRWVLTSISIGFLSYFLMFDGVWLPETPSSAFPPPKVSIDTSNANLLPLESYGRYWVFGEMRAPDMGLDSILMERYSDFRSTKGLFWESAYANPLQSSYLVTMFMPPAVLDYFYDGNFSCQAIRRLADQYIWLYNVKGIIAGESDLRYLPSMKRECWKSILAGGTENFRFVKRGEIHLTGRVKEVLGLRFRIPRAWVTGVINDGIEAISATQVKFLPASGKFPYFGGAAAQRFNTAKIGTESNRTFFALPQDKEVFEKLQDSFPPAPFSDSPAAALSMQKLDDGTIQIDLPSQPTWFFLKLSPQPGTHFWDSGGQDLEFVRGVPGIVGRARGRIYMGVQPTSLMKLFYGLSLLFVVVFCVRAGLMGGKGWTRGLTRRYNRIVGETS